jgi:hypothetical protein
MSSKKDLKKDIDQLKQTSSDSGIAFLHKHPDTGQHYNRFKEEVDPSDYGLVVSYGYYHAPFVVEREKAEAEGWPIVGSVTTDVETELYDDLVEVSEWCINPWVDNPDGREYYSE